MTANFISDSVMQKFLRFARAKLFDPFPFIMRGWNNNFDLRFEFSVKFRVGCYALIWGLY